MDGAILICLSKFLRGIKSNLHILLGPSKGFWRAWENGHLFSGSLGAPVIIFRELGSTSNYFHGAGEH